MRHNTSVDGVSVIADVPRNLHVYPDKTGYTTGEEVICSAQGKPEVTFIWHNLVTSELIRSHILTMTKEMVGAIQVWQCLASNVIRGHKHTIDWELTFKVKGKRIPV